MPRPRHVLLVLPVSPQDGWARPMMEGALGEAERLGWRLEVAALAHLRERLGTARADGVLLHAARRDLEGLRFPRALRVVNLSNRDPMPGIPRVHNDEAAIGRLAADFFLQRGHDRFAFLQRPTHAYSVERGIAFAGALRARGHACTSVQDPADLVALARPRRPGSGRITPLAVLASSDLRAMDAVRAAEVAQVDLPRSMAILGVDNDAVLTRLCRPNLSSIVTDNPRIGREAARLLSRLMDGAPAPDGPVLVPPLGIEERQSTSPVAAHDPRVAALVAHAREHLGRGLRVDDLVARSRIPRRSLERLFREDLGMSPAAMLRRVQLHRATELLSRTDLPLASVAEACGFAEHASFTHAFRRWMGQAPSAYRDERRAPGA